MLFLTSIVIITIGAECVLAVPVCDQLCAHIFQEVCGSDNKTYQNLCLLQNADCEARKHGGTVTLTHGGSCTFPSRQCHILCDDETPDGPVCGTDAVTYKNQCLFLIAECQAANRGFGLKIAHTGNCTKRDSACPDNCDYHLEPVCSMGNVTYRNPCILQQTACKFSYHGHTSTRYQLAHNGSCDGSNVFQTSKLDCRQYEPKGAFAPENPDQLLITSCPHVRQPICSKELITFRSGCDYCRLMASRHQLGPDKMVDVVHNGACPDYTHSIFG